MKSFIPATLLAIVGLLIMGAIFYEKSQCDGKFVPTLFGFECIQVVTE